MSATVPQTETKNPTKSKCEAVKRIVTGASLLMYMSFAIYGGPPLIIFNAVFLQIKCSNEVIRTAYSAKRIPNIRHFEKLNWYFVIFANYFFCGETISHHFEAYMNKYSLLRILVAYHRFFALFWYAAGIFWFLILLRKKAIRDQFTLIVWMHFLLLGISLQAFMTVENMFQGLIWVLLPLCLVILNDVSAYFFGKLFGKTPLISLSPKKTLEGFIYGGISTVVLGAVISYLFCQVQYFICPIKYIEVDGVVKMSTDCTPSQLFTPKEYIFMGLTWNLYPFVLHSIPLSCFASLIAPFGGFCASGFKRACKVKNFGELLPGHGGFMDRLDCQFLMSTFVNVYIGTFVKSYDVDMIYKKILQLSDKEQLEFYNLLEKHLTSAAISGK
ncbi:unnamed protein product [Callosobruchus maculatus]|uniref:phosphatidate cytidylyltransferase n=1 Tax=Callosobruchus maculatus TaxID=64391 RepID=A0A653DYP5_CALMS|nr:unnamed protein product [Callosobruchus maculatus]